MIGLGLLILLGVLFFPTVTFWRPEYALAAVGAVWTIGRYGLAGVGALKIELLLLLVSGLFATVSLMGQALLSPSLIQRDLMVIFRYAFYAGCLLSGLGIGAALTRVRPMAGLVGLLIPTVTVVTLLQYLNVGGIALEMVLWYGTPDDYERIGEFWRRATGTIGNPNYWGLVCGVLLLYSAYRVFYEKQLLWLVGVAAMLLCITLTGSRTSLVAPVIAWIAFSFLAGGVVSIGRILWIVPLSLVAAAIGVQWLLSTSIYEFAERFSVQNVLTWELRVQHWLSLQERIFSSVGTFLIGSGPNKAEVITFADNMYLLLLRDFGVLGLGAFLSLAGFVVLRLRGIYRLNVAHRQIAGWMLLSWLLMLAFNITADAWFAVRPMTLLLLMYGSLIGMVWSSERQAARVRRGRQGYVDRTVAAARPIPAGHMPVGPAMSPR